MKLFLACILMPTLTFGQVTINWDAPIPVAESTFGNQRPRIALDRNDAPIVLWGNLSEDAPYLARWSDTQFATPTRLTPETMEVFIASWAGPDLAAFGDTIYAVFKENPENTAPIYCVHSFDGGITFSDPIIVDGMIGDAVSRFPSIAVDAEGQPIVAYMKLDNDFTNPRYVVSSSDDMGSTFQMDVLASDFSGGEVCDCCPVGIATNDNYVVTLYRDNLDNLRNAWAGISTNNGDAFTDGIQIDQTNWIINACPSTGPDGVIIGDSLYSVFMSAGTGDERVYFSASSLSTLNDLPDARLSADFAELAYENYPRIANHDQAVAIVWKDVALGAHVKLKFTEDIESRFSDSIIDVSYYNLEDYNPSNADVAVSATDIHVVWQEGSNGQVMYRKGTYTTPSPINQPTNPDIIQIYPNPANNQITIQLADVGNYLSIYDMTGALCMATSLETANSCTLDISSFPEGPYIIVSVGCNGSRYSEVFTVVR